MVLNINENVLKGQIQSYLSNPESMLKLPPTESSSFKKLEMKIGEKQDIWSKYVNTEENRIDDLNKATASVYLHLFMVCFMNL